MFEQTNVEVNIVEEGIKAQINSQLEEAEINLEQQQKDAIVNELINKKILTIDKIKELENFTHVEVPEGEEPPSKTLLINGLLVYLFDKEVAGRAHATDYEEYLEDNELYSDEYPYSEFLTDNELVETFPTQRVTEVHTFEIGGIYISALRAKAEAEKMLSESTTVVERIEPLISDNFLSIQR